MFVKLSNEAFLGEVTCNQSYVRKMESLHQMKAGKNRDKGKRVPGTLGNMRDTSETRSY